MVHLWVIDCIRAFCPRTCQSSRHCLRERNWRHATRSQLQLRRSLLHSPSGPLTGVSTSETVPLRKQLKDEAKKNRAARGFEPKRRKEINIGPRQDKWELTVGIEIHAQLNTERKLFSSAAASVNDVPNSHVALFDVAFPGTQPSFQMAALIPALRAATALQCSIQRRSRFDRKHYFYQDQPAGYQITQYYEPFAKDGTVTLYAHDGIAPEDGDSITIGIKQIQMEQDTAKSLLQPPETHLLDFNRVGHPLIEIITLPQIHHAQTAAAYVRKVQGNLQAVNAVTVGMEMGGLRADVNVSVRRKGRGGQDDKTYEYHGVKGLGQKTEIKNLSSFKAVQDAIIAERNRQIDVLEKGGRIEGETRGWALGSTETTRLRGKEGEVDYRYMPDPDLGPVTIGQDVLDHILRTMPAVPDETLKMLTKAPYYLTAKDAKTMMLLDDGSRVDYYRDTFDDVRRRMMSTDSLDSTKASAIATGKTAGNWVLHELGGLLTTSGQAWSESTVPADQLALLLALLLQKKITGRTAKQLLTMKFESDPRSVDDIVDEEGLWLVPMQKEEYIALAQRLLEENGDVVQYMQKTGRMGGLQWFIGQMMRQGEEGKVEAIKAEAALKEVLGITNDSR